MIICEIRKVYQNEIDNYVLKHENDISVYNKKCDDDKKSFLCSRNIIKDILIKEFEISDYIIKYSKNGKPKIYLKNGDCIFVSISNKDGFCFVAVGGQEVGVDFEKINPNVDYNNIVKKYNPNLDIKSVTEFYYHWTLIESYIKLYDLRLFDVLKLSINEILNSSEVLMHEIYNENYVFCLLCINKVKIKFINNL